MFFVWVSLKFSDTTIGVSLIGHYFNPERLLILRGEITFEMKSRFHVHELMEVSEMS